MSFFTVPRPSVFAALLLSLGLHAAVGVWVKVRTTSTDGQPERPDVWSGRGIELAPRPVDLARQVEVAVDETPAPASPAPGEASGERSVELEPACVNGCAAASPPARTTTKPSKPLGSVEKPPSGAAASTGSAPSASAPSASAPSASASTTAGAGEAFGVAGLPPGVRHLPHAFTRALSQGSWGVAGFRTAPAGTLCDVHVAIAVNEDKTLGALEYPIQRERDALPPLCRTMFENAYRLVEHGEFSLDPSRLTSGAMRVEIEVVVSDGEPRPELDGDGDPNALWSESKEAPGVSKRGRSTFVLNSGRRIDAFVDLE